MSARLVDGEVTAVAGFDEPDVWAVVVLFDGEVIGAPLRQLYTSEAAVRARMAELRDRFPHHEVRAVRRTVVWTEEGAAATAPSFGTSVLTRIPWQGHEQRTQFAGGLPAGSGVAG